MKRLFSISFLALLCCLAIGKYKAPAPPAFPHRPASPDMIRLKPNPPYPHCLVNGVVADGLTLSSLDKVESMDGCYVY